MKRFEEFVKKYRWLLEYSVTFLIVPFFLDFLWGLGPPWPNSIAVSLFTSVAAFLILIFCFASWDEVGKVRLKRYVQWCTPIAFLTMGAYIFLTAFFVYRESNDVRVVKGWVLKPSIVAILNEQKSETVESLLEGFKYDATRIWEEAGVFANRAILLTSWLLFFCAVSLVMAIFAIQQTRAEELMAQRLARKGDGPGKSTDNFPRPKRLRAK